MCWPSHNPSLGMGTGDTEPGKGASIPGTPQSSGCVWDPFLPGLDSVCLVHFPQIPWISDSSWLGLKFLLGFVEGWTLWMGRHLSFWGRAKSNSGTLSEKRQHLGYSLGPPGLQQSYSMAKASLLGVWGWKSPNWSCRCEAELKRAVRDGTEQDKA